jgi:uncharacterized paraquat-inducible protein A
MQKCKNICLQPEYKASYGGAKNWHESPYAVSSIKYCSICSTFLNLTPKSMWRKRYCPCCHTALRNNTRNSVTRKMNKEAWERKAIG